MTYELAKKLKDAGFRQDDKYEEGCYDETTGVTRWENGQHVYYPNLAELIKACGDKFVSLNRLFDDYHQTSGWQATGMGGKYPQIETSGAIETNSETPEEAVAELWLKLNENNPKSQPESAQTS